MSRHRILPSGFLLAGFLASALSACAGVGSKSTGGGGEPTEEASGIQTRAIRSAPAAQQARNESKPLSELDTPEAIAARELAKSSGLSTQAAASSAAPATSASSAARSAAAKPPAGSAAAVARAAPAGAAGNGGAVSARPASSALQKGAKVRLRSGAALAARPSAGSESAPAVASQFELGAQIYNAGGYWWYVSSGQEAGWVLQTDIQP